MSYNSHKVRVWVSKCLFFWYRLARSSCWCWASSV